MSDPRSDSINVMFCAVDFSETASLAVTHATQLARRHKAGLVLGHVVEPLPVISYPILMVPADAEKELYRFASERLEELAGMARAQVQAADMVVLNKVDLVGQTELDELKEQMKEAPVFWYNEKAVRIFEGVRADKRREEILINAGYVKVRLVKEG